MTDDLVVAAFKNALVRRRPAPGFIFHTDRGSQYCSKRFRSLVKGARGAQSMSATGCCYDNAITESSFGTLKRELVHYCSFVTRPEAQSRIFRYIDGFYNRNRRHSAIGYRSPEQFEQARVKMAVYGSSRDLYCEDRSVDQFGRGPFLVYLPEKCLSCHPLGLVFCSDVVDKSAGDGDLNVEKDGLYYS